MKSLKLLSLLLAGSTLVACGETIDDTDLPPDAEFGLETLDGKDDSFAIRPGSPEAEAVVNYANRAIANNAEGVAYRDEIDSKLHKTAAKNIAAYRAGGDGVFGTADDALFADLGALDKIPYVGRSALMQLFGLAEAAGYFQRASVDCADYVDHDRWNNYQINSYADLLEYENSRCTTLTGNLYIQISGTDLLPPAARDNSNLKHLRTINGNLQITTSNHITALRFAGLETVTGTVRAESPTGRLHTVDFAALKSAKSIYLSAIESSLFPALQHNDRIDLEGTDLEGFTGLKTAGQIAISERAIGVYNVSFPALTDVEGLAFNVHRQNSWTMPDIAFTGGFPKLTRVGDLSLSSGKYGQLKFARLTDARSVSTATTVDPFLGMAKLATVGALHSNLDEFATNVHMGPAALETVGSLSVNSGFPVDGYDVLKTVESNVTITTREGVEGFDAVTTIGGSVNLTIGQSRSPLSLNGFNKVSYLNSITISANNAPVTIGPLFEGLENTEGGISLLNNAGFTDNPVFKKLGSMGGGLRVDALLVGADLMPVLEIVDGSVTINSTPAELKGFPLLERIEGNLTLRANLNTMTGMRKLTAIGANLSVPRTLGTVELDAFLNRLTEFSGTINYN